MAPPPLPEPQQRNAQEQRQPSQPLTFANIDTSQPPVHQEEEELRLDRADGNWYAKEDFIDFYGGLREWDAAPRAPQTRSNGPNSSTPASHVPTQQPLPQHNQGAPPLAPEYSPAMDFSDFHREIAELEETLDNPSLSQAKRYAVKKSLAMKRAELSRALRKQQH